MCKREYRTPQSAHIEDTIRDANSSNYPGKLVGPRPSAVTVPKCNQHGSVASKYLITPNVRSGGSPVRRRLRRPARPLQRKIEARESLRSKKRQQRI
jgi:hypothetical protein